MVTVLNYDILNTIKKLRFIFIKMSIWGRSDKPGVFSCLKIRLWMQFESARFEGVRINLKTRDSQYIQQAFCVKLIFLNSVWTKGISFSFF